MKNTNELRIFTDGGSRGNPGDAALGVYITDSGGKILSRIGEKIGYATNNVAEYSAIKKALEWVLENKKEFTSLSGVKMFMDSQLAVSQLNGLYKIKNAKLREIFFEIKMLEGRIGLPITFSHIPREKNKDADLLVNLALDNKVIE